MSNSNSNSHSHNDNPLQKKKKKGHAPAHQNSFAFRHNPKSKKTAAILESPIYGVCRRCHDKLEWRKRYRKYKPLTQPSRCNLCSQRNVRAAYHTICTNCAQSSSKALQFLEEWNQKQQQTEQETDPQPATPLEEEGQEEEEEPHPQQQHLFIPATRVCAICVQEPVISENHCHATEQVSNDEDPMARPLKLRELKTLRRQRERAAVKPRSQPNPQQEEHEDDHSNEEQQEQHELQSKTEGLIIDDGYDSDDANDPFLQAVGGADKLLTGEAYQQKLLWELEHKPNNS